MGDTWDEDIARMQLSDVEKNGLQVYRNYSKAVDSYRVRSFVQKLDSENVDMEPLKHVNRLILKEDVRMVAVIVCAFLDDQLKDLYRRELPDGIPGGVSELLNGFGPISRFGQRIQIAYALGWLQQDILSEAHKLRGLRNAISHRWDSAELEARLDTFITKSMSRIEEHFAGVESLKGSFELLSKVDLFRLRLVWLVARFFYESFACAKAVKARVDPVQALYVYRPHPKLLHAVMEVTGPSTLELSGRLGVGIRRGSEGV